jgi:hypothetical protein
VLRCLDKTRASREDAKEGELTVEHRA